MNFKAWNEQWIINTVVQLTNTINYKNPNVMTAMNMNSYNFQPNYDFQSQSPQFFPKTHSPRAVQAFVPATELLPMNKMELNTPMKKSLSAAT